MLSIDYSTNIIFVPKAYTQFVSTDPQTGLEVRQMNLTTFAQDIADLQDDAEGVWAPTAFEYTAPVSVGGVQLAPVVIILSPYTIEYEDGQYAVNLVGANTNVQDKTVVNQVSIRPNNSAGLTFSDAINNQSFQNAAVWIDTVDGIAGTQFPLGTTTEPVNNATDAATIANRVNLHNFYLAGTLTASGNYGVNRYTVFGNNPTTAIIIATALNVADSGFERCAIVGSITGRGSYKDCSIGKTLGLAGVEGIFDNCGIAGNITLNSSATEPIIFKDCISAIAGLSKPIFNCNATAAGINFRRYTGGAAITNFSNPNGKMSLDLMGSEVSLDSTTCTDGEIVARGVGRIIDENGTVLPYGLQTCNGITIKNLLLSDEMVQELYQLQGLDSAAPLTVTPTQRTAGSIDQTISGDGENVTVVTRN